MPEVSLKNSEERHARLVAKATFVSAQQSLFDGGSRVYNCCPSITATFRDDLKANTVL